MLLCCNTRENVSCELALKFVLSYLFVFLKTVMVLVEVSTLAFQSDVRCFTVGLSTILFSCTRTYFLLTAFLCPGVQVKTRELLRQPDKILRVLVRWTFILSSGESL